MKIPSYLPFGATLLLFTTRTSWVDSSIGSCIGSVVFSGLALLYLGSVFSPTVKPQAPRFFAFYFISVGYLLVEIAAAQFDADPQVMVFTAGINALAVLLGVVIEIFFFARSKKWI